MRVKTLLIFPLIVMSCFVIYSTYHQSISYGDDQHIQCEKSPMYYYINPYFKIKEKQKKIPKSDRNDKQCGWSDFDQKLIYSICIINIIVNILMYVKISQLRFVIFILGQLTFGCSIYLYRLCYAAHDYCLSFILPVYKNETIKIVCEDDSFYVVVGMLFLISLVEVLNSICYIIKDKNGYTLGDIDFGTEMSQPSTDPYAKDVRKKEERPPIKND